MSPATPHILLSFARRLALNWCRDERLVFWRASAPDKALKHRYLTFPKYQDIRDYQKYLAYFGWS
jgi:hypothetical protein